MNINASISFEPTSRFGRTCSRSGQINPFQSLDVWWKEHGFPVAFPLKTNPLKQGLPSFSGASGRLCQSYHSCSFKFKRPRPPWMALLRNCCSKCPMQLGHNAKIYHNMSTYFLGMNSHRYHRSHLFWFELHSTVGFWHIATSWESDGVEGAFVESSWQSSCYSHIFTQNVEMQRTWTRDATWIWGYRDPKWTWIYMDIHGNTVYHNRWWCT